MGDGDHDGGSAGGTTDVARSSRDPGALRRDLERWLVSRLPERAAPSVTDLQATSANGMSSETVLFDASWSDAGEPSTRSLVARLAPDVDDVPVFPHYDLEAQFRTMKRVGELTSVPVPRVWWYEGDRGAVGTPFFVMSRVEGEVPPDVMPYNFGDNWLFDAGPDDRRRLQDSSVAVLAELHGIAEPAREFEFLVHDRRDPSPLRHKVDRTRHWYEWVIAGGERSALVDRAFTWLEDHWPARESSAVLSWGDSRIGNVMYRDFEPVAVLDWEMACLCPRELDVAWMSYAHQVFEDIAAELGMPGMPDFLCLDDVATTYERLTGVRLHDLQFFTVLAAVQYAIVFIRTGQRAIHFGEREAPDRIDDLIMNHRGLERSMTAEWT